MTNKIPTLKEFNSKIQNVKNRISTFDNAIKKDKLRIDSLGYGKHNLIEITKSLNEAQNELTNLLADRMKHYGPQKDDDES